MTQHTRSPSPSRTLQRQLLQLPRTRPRLLLCLSLLLCVLLILLLRTLLNLLPHPSPALARLRDLDTEPATAGAMRARKCWRPRPVPLYVFLHLHKTGGNNLKRALFGFAKRNNLTLHHTCRPTLGDGALAAWWFARSKRPGSRYDCNLDAVAAMTAAQRDQLDIIVGHQHVGVHALFPGRDVRYFTLLRHPLGRKLAHFRHFEANSSSHLATYLIERNRNYMTKRLATAAYTSELGADLRARFIDVESFAARAALRAAKRNLAARFFFAGLQERYAESVCVLARILNAACGRSGRLAASMPLYAARVARTRGSRRRTGRDGRSLSPRVRRAVLAAEGADAELFRFAERLFEDKLAKYAECRAARVGGR